MMAAYQTQPGAMHPGMAQPGHPAMTPGQPINPAQMQQMGHPGVSGPGIPHSQAGAMMGMQPGANGMPGMGGQMGGVPGQMAAQGMAGGIPNHAFNQMNPQMQQQVLQQQAAMQPGNPNDMQRQMAIQQRMMQQQRAMQQQGGMQLSPQQLQQLQNSGVQGMHPQSVQLNAHLQQQMMQRHQMQQAQQAAQQNQQAQQHNQQLQQQLAMQHANSQSSNPGSQQGAPNPAISQPQQPPQMRPQSRTANPTEPSHGQPPPTPQSSGPGQPQQPGQQTPQQNPQASMPQQGPQAGMNPQQMAMLQRQRAAMAAQQQQQQAGQPQQGMNPQLSMQRMAAAAAQAQAQAQSQGFSGAFVLRLLLLCNEISGFDSQRGKDLAEWQQTINKHFGQEARIVHEMRFPPVQPQGPNAAELATSTKSYEVIRPIIPKYFQTFYDSDATAFRIYPEHPRESFGNGQCQVVFQRCTFHIDYLNGSRLEMSGSLSFNSGIGNESNVVDYMEIKTEAAVEVITRKAVEELIGNWSPTMDSKTSPKMTKKPPKAQQKSQAALEGLTINNFPKPPRGKNGPLPRLQAFLEVGETMNVMNELICFAEDHKMRPGPAMEALVAQYEREGGPPTAQQQLQQAQMNNPHINYPPNGIPAGNRTPSMGNMPMPGQQFSSPAMSNLNAPMMNGSPHIPNHPGLAPNMNMPNSHTPSPHQSNMAAPQMMPQHSQQGTNSSAASANTSPNVNNKRRRSTVKMEGDEGGGEGGGPAAGANRVKPSPRMGNKKGKQS